MIQSNKLACMEDKLAMLTIATQKMISRLECITKCSWKTILKMQKVKLIVKSKKIKIKIFKTIKLKNSQLSHLSLSNPSNHYTPLGLTINLMTIRASNQHKPYGRWTVEGPWFQETIIEIKESIWNKKREE